MASWMDANGGVDVMVAVPAPYLAWCTERKPKGLFVLAQNVSAEGFGAHTGEYTADMLKSCHVDGAIVGHSERRARFGDEDAVVAAKVDALIAADLLVVFCCGETLQEREGGRAPAKHVKHAPQQGRVDRVLFVCIVRFLGVPVFVTVITPERATRRNGTDAAPEYVRESRVVTQDLELDILLLGDANAARPERVVESAAAKSSLLQPEQQLFQNMPMSKPGLVSPQ